MTRETRRRRIRRWIDALRSGEYSQTTGSLRDQRGHCCLGVACDLYADARGTPGEFDADHGFHVDGYIALSMPPDRVNEYFGITQSDADTLAARNDHGDTFGEIADKIEREILSRS